MFHAYRLAMMLALAATLLAACNKPVLPTEPLRSVKILTVDQGTATAGAEFAGEVRARVESRLGFRVAGKIVQRPVELGQRVQAGQVLAQLDPQDYQLAAQAARAQVAAAQTNRDLAHADYQRFKELRAQNFISGAELERREANAKAAQAQLEQAQAQLAGQGNQARYATLVAEVPGVVTAVEAEPGQVVAAGTPVVRIAQDGARDVVFAVPENQVARVAAGSAVAVRVWGAKDTLQGQVREVAASADPITRTFTVKATLHGADVPALGSTVTVRPQALARVGAAVIKLPLSAVFQHGAGSAVWLLDRASMRVNPVPVTVAGADGNALVIASGLQMGMQVVAAGTHVLTPGQQVSVYKENSAIAQSIQAPAASHSVAPASAAQ